MNDFLYSLLLSPFEDYEAYSFELATSYGSKVSGVTNKVMITDPFGSNNDYLSGILSKYQITELSRLAETSSRYVLNLKKPFFDASCEVSLSSELEGKIIDQISLEAQSLNAFPRPVTTLLIPCLCNSRPAIIAPSTLIFLDLSYQFGRSNDSLVLFSDILPRN